MVDNMRIGRCHVILVLLSAALLQDAASLNNETAPPLNATSVKQFAVDPALWTAKVGGLSNASSKTTTVVANSAVNSTTNASGLPEEANISALDAIAEMGPEAIAEAESAIKIREMGNVLGMPMPFQPMIGQDFLMTPRMPRKERTKLMEEDLVVSWGGLAILLVLSVLAGAWKIHKVRQRGVVAPQVMGRLLEEQGPQQISNATFAEEDPNAHSVANATLS